VLALCDKEHQQGDRRTGAQCCACRVTLFDARGEKPLMEDALAECWHRQHGGRDEREDEGGVALRVDELPLRHLTGRVAPEAVKVDEAEKALHICTCQHGQQSRPVAGIRANDEIVDHVPRRKLRSGHRADGEALCRSCICAAELHGRRFGDAVGRKHNVERVGELLTEQPAVELRGREGVLGQRSHPFSKESDGVSAFERAMRSRVEIQIVQFEEEHVALVHEAREQHVWFRLLCLLQGRPHVAAEGRICVVKDHMQDELHGILGPIATTMPGSL